SFRTTSQDHQPSCDGSARRRSRTGGKTSSVSGGGLSGWGNRAWVSVVRRAASPASIASMAAAGSESRTSREVSRRMRVPGARTDDYAREIISRGPDGAQVALDRPLYDLLRAAQDIS